MRICLALIYFPSLKYWLRFVKNGNLYLIVVILCSQRLQKLVEAAPAVAVEVLAADNFPPEGVSPKADQYGEGRLIGISKDLEKLIANWRDIVGPNGKILRSVDRHGNIGEKLEPSAISCARCRRILPSQTIKNPASGRGIRFGWAPQST